MDRDYTGNVGVILGNIGTATLSVQLGHRIAQLICECIAVPVPTEVSEFGTTARGNSGFGSTGITAVQVQPLELHEPINSATFPVLDGSLLSRLAFLWAGFLPQMASLFLYTSSPPPHWAQWRYTTCLSSTSLKYSNSATCCRGIPIAT